MTAAPDAAPVRSAPFLTGAMRIFELSLGEMLWSRRTIFMGLVVAAPVIVAMVVRMVQSAGVVPLRIQGAPVEPMTMFGGMIWLLFLRFIVPVLGVFYGTSLIADEVEDKTITYLFTRPIRRGAVLVGKYLAYLVCTTLVVLPSVMVAYFLLVPFNQVGASFTWLLVDLGLLAIGLAAYGALFALVGAVLRRPLVIGLVFAFGWEQAAMGMPGYLKRFTVAHYLQALVPHALPPDDSVASILQAVFTDTPTTGTALFWLAAILAVSLLLAVRTVERREYVLEQ